MKSTSSVHPGLAAGLAREAAGLLLPAALAVGLFLLVPGDSRSQVEPSQARGKPEDAVLCETWHRASGETVPLDLDRVKRAYLDLKTRLARSLETSKPQAAIDLRQPYDAGLPSCREDATRTVSIPAEKGGRLKGRTLYFVRAPDPAGLELPAEVEKDRGAMVLVLQVRSLGDLPAIAKSLGRPVSLGTAEFAKSLGVRCANTWVRVSEKGDALDLHEIR